MLYLFYKERIMERMINNQFNDYAFNRTKAFVGVNLITAYHSILNLPYCNPLLHDPNWNQLYFVFFVIKGSLAFITNERKIILEENQIMFGQTSESVYLVDNGEQAEFLCFQDSISLHISQNKQRPKSLGK